MEKCAHIWSPEVQQRGGVLYVVFLVLAGPVLVLPAADLTVARSQTLKIFFAFISVDFFCSWLPVMHDKLSVKRISGRVQIGGLESCRAYVSDFILWFLVVSELFS